MSLDQNWSVLMRVFTIPALKLWVSNSVGRNYAASEVTDPFKRVEKGLIINASTWWGLQSARLSHSLLMSNFRVKHVTIQKKYHWKSYLPADQHENRT